MTLRTAITGQASAWTAALLAMLLVAPSETLAGELLDVGSVASPRSEKVAAGARDGDGFTGFAFGPAIADRATMAFVLPGAPVEVGAAVNLRWHVQNAMPWPVTVDLALVDDRGGRLGWRVGLQPGPPVTLALPLAATSPRRWGMRAGPPMPIELEGERVHVALAASGTIDARRLVEISISVPAPDSPQILRLGKLFVDPRRDDERAAYSAIIDGNGRYVRGPWPPPASGTSRSDPDPGGTPDTTPGATANMTPDPTPGSTSGSSRGSTSGSASAAAPGVVANDANATGWFRTERGAGSDGRRRWRLVDPDGNPFLSIGINAVTLHQSATIVEGREFMFTALPAADDAAARFFDHRDGLAEVPATAGAQSGRAFGRGRSFDFLGANLWREFGNAFESRWRERVAQRLRAWGFNTLGAWTDHALYDSARLPYMAIVHPEGRFARLDDGQSYWGGIADVFDPAFAAAVAAAVRDQVAPRRDDRLLIGWFVDNELDWGTDSGPRRFAVARATLATDGAAADGHAKRALVAQLRERHGQVAAVAERWQRPLANWDDLLPPIAIDRQPDGDRAEVAADFAAFQALHAERYYRTVAEALAADDPHHLYLGSRFAAYTPEAVQACARWCDVISFNRYVPRLSDGLDLAAIAALGKPALLTEFHAGSSDRGPFWPGVLAVADEAGRAPAWERMLQSVLDDPTFIGVHWFQYYDQPVSGRWLDGENGHLGLVAITDEPWRPFVDRLGTINRAAYGRFARISAPSGETSNGR
jgi:hypothetical protein